MKQAPPSGGHTPGPNGTPPRRGRRPGRTDTRDTILSAAREQFLAQGYHAVTLRAIAAEAGVDAALINYYFGSKRGLFGAAMALTANPADLLERVFASDKPTVVPRALRTLLASWDSADSGPGLVAMLRSVSADESAAALVREVMEREVIERVAERLGGAHAQARAMAFCAQMAGIITTRYLLRLEPIASMTPDEVVRYCGPSLAVALREKPRSGRRRVAAAP
ncbi:TetR/AcrR family transcriptional regulator [Actinacidiphila bryophytorum]|uniref:TetR family transcriptional regulator n=1 Tax=Actinacidiphila bryophytorum TaxID=1436133 RepID=A0A9W4H8M0_9ACTN|nr:TetR family transcriptional regulator [Actinacidiphila bryophytorum]MBM9438329.1 TetR family transcriptional regulator [Actinacidiphila bryophytorum]MBN6542646.1 TetR family transcriptional regulator [Actinacidiphila bryophytorum]CAG7658036.1 TetR family transcriptional regulator [Actinacidiphila bryophytorum]